MNFSDIQRFVKHCQEELDLGQQRSIFVMELNQDKYDSRFMLESRGVTCFVSFTDRTSELDIMKDIRAKVYSFHGKEVPAWYAS